MKTNERISMKNSKRIVYSINVEDIQNVAMEVLDRKLTKKEVSLVERSLGDHIKWFDAIEFAINENISTRKKRA